MPLISGERLRNLLRYEQLGTPEALEARLATPFPTNDDYAPLPGLDNEELHLAAGLLEDDEPPIEEATSWLDK